MAVFRLRAIVTRDSLKRRPSRSLLEPLRRALRPRSPLAVDAVARLEPGFLAGMASQQAVALVAGDRRALFRARHDLQLDHGRLSAARRPRPWVNGVQVSVGLLILSVIAAVSLAEERARGSLDLFLTTMLSTRQIVLGKWLGTYRAVPLFAVLPAVVAFGLAYDRPEQWTAVVVLIVYIFCAGAAITSLGLAMATWLPRVGSAVAATVSMYLAITVG